MSSPAIPTSPRARLLANVGLAIGAESEWPTGLEAVDRSLDAIEAAAAATERARLRAAVEGLEEHWVNGAEWDYGINRFLDYSAVLALLDEQP